MLYHLLNNKVLMIQYSNELIIKSYSNINDDMSLGLSLNTPLPLVTHGEEVNLLDG